MTNSSNLKKEESDYRAYLDERKAQIEAKVTVSTFFDRAILTLSGGALALSIVFVRQIAADPIRASIFLKWTWAVFAFAIVAMLSSMLISQHAIQSVIDTLDHKQKTGCEHQQHKNRWATYTKGLKWLSIGLFFVGVGLFAWFSFENLPVTKRG